MNMLENQNHAERLLLTYKSHGLKDLNNARLMNRVDSKFVLPLNCLPELLAEMRRCFSVLQINGKRSSVYFNQYFDTPELNFYRDHHNGKLNRYKVRHRTYVDTETQFVEVKFKNNHKRTLKSRIQVKGLQQDRNIVNPFVSEKLGQPYSNLKIIQQSGYCRIALAAEERSERLTLDFDLWYQSVDQSQRITLPGFFIAELKQKKHSKHSPLYRFMSRYGFTSTSFSKYCIGCALLNQGHIKRNRFKPVLSKIEKLAA